MKFFLLDPIVVTWKLFMKDKKPKETPSEPLQVPMPLLGKTIPVLFGSRPITDPFMAWYGDIRIVKVKVSSKGKK